MMNPKAFLVLRKWLVKDVPVIFASAIMVVMVLNVALADWTLDPLHDLFFANTYGPLFPGVHPSSVAFVVVAALVMARRKKSLPIGIVMGFSSASIHELTLASFSLVFYGWQNVVGGLYPVGLFVVFGLALWKADKAGRKTLAIIILVMFSFASFLTIAHVGVPWSPQVVDDILAVGSWFLVCLPWFIPQRWIQK